jgi:hypothetical protein
MKVDTWQQLEGEFARFPILKAESVPIEEIELASSHLGMPFPNDYSQFIQRYGGAIVGSFPIFGLRQAEPMGNRWSVIDVNRNYRNQGWAGIDAWLIISADLAGNPIGILPDESVWVSDHDLGSIERLSENFEAFLREHGLGIPT